MAPLTAVLDANVLYPAPLRDFLMRIALSDLIHARWSAAIHEEWIRNVLVVRPDLSRSQLERTRTLMDSHVRDALVEGYESLILQLDLPDPNDRHVLAAAIHAQAGVIVTFNLRDFPAASLTPYGITAQHPDAFLLELIELDPTRVCAAAAAQRQSLHNPPKSQEEFLDIMRQQGIPRTVMRLREVCNNGI